MSTTRTGCAECTAGSRRCRGAFAAHYGFNIDPLAAHCPTGKAAPSGKC